jgi:hypothetical protein
MVEMCLPLPLPPVVQLPPINLPLPSVVQQLPPINLPLPSVVQQLPPINPPLPLPLFICEDQPQPELQEWPTVVGED